MSRRRVWVGLALAFVVLVTSAGVGWAVWGEDLRYRHTLVKYDNDPGLANRYVNLDDGEAQFSIGSPDRHRIVVQWRDPDGHGWTEPETVWTDEKNIAVDNTVRYGGGTVGIRQAYTPDVHDDEDDDVVDIGIVCRKLACTAQESPGYGGEAQVTPDGRTVYLGQYPEGAYLWTSGKGIHLAPWSGHPGFEYGVVSPSEPVLAPDGSLRVVTSRPSRGSCTYKLLASASGTADLTPVGRTTARLRGPEKSDCRSSLQTESADWVKVVEPDENRVRAFWFVRDGDAWATTRDDPSGLRLVITGDRGCCETGVAGFVHWNSVAFGSPDGHRIQVQTRLLGEETWSEPELLDGAPAGYRCTWLEEDEVGEEGYAVLMTCHSGRLPADLREGPYDDIRGDAYVVAVTPDLRQWESTFVTGVRREPQVDGDQVRVGDTTWTPEDGFVTR